MEYIDLTTVGDTLDRITFIPPHGGDPINFDRGYLTTDDTYARVRIARSRYDASPAPVTPADADVIASTSDGLAYTGYVSHGDFVQKNGVDYFELRCTPTDRID